MGDSNLESMKFFKILCLVASAVCFPQSSFPRIDVQRYVDKVKKENYPSDNRVKASISSKAPSSAAALAYVKSVVKEGLCADAAEAYLESILNGESREEAIGEAARAYITAFNTGKRYIKGGACEAADWAWKQARLSARREGGGKKGDHVLDATLAFIGKWPGVQEGNPCAVAGTNYVKQILAGKSHLDATTASMRGYIKAFKKLAARGESLNDEACHDASRAFFDAVPDKSDPIIGAGFTAFSDKIFNGNGVVFDPVCLDAMETFIDSQCTAATLSYTKALNTDPSAAGTAGMIAYISEAIKQKDRKVDPVCGAATLAYWDAYIEEKSESAASEAAAVAYIEALDKNPDFDKNSACGKAADAYIAEFEV